jgi:NADH-quinone oxidoreductase subunit F
MDIKLRGAQPEPAEREAVDAVLGPARSAWDGGSRDNARDRRTADVGGDASRTRRHLLIPVLQALQARVGWVSEGGLEYACARLNVPPADAWGVTTFFALLATSPRPPRVVHVCDDIACTCRGSEAVIADLEVRVGPPLGHSHRHEPTPGPAVSGPAAWMRSPCLGLCEHGPAALVTDAGPSPSERLVGHVSAGQVVDFLGGAPVSASPANSVVRQPASELRLLRRINRVDPTSLAEYRASGGYAALEKALAMGAPRVIAEVVASQLVGRGGAAYPTGRKWEAVAAEAAGQKYLVCNADESEPGTFKDRVILEDDPFAVVESMTIAAFATGCTKGFAYVRGEYPLGTHRLQFAVDEARHGGLLGADIMGSGVSFDMEIRRGAGAYVCGEETALFEAIEGRAGFPRNKPPFPVAKGLFGRPTVVNNVETLVNVPHIVLEGGEAFAAVGTPASTGTRLFSVSGCVRWPGLYEVPLGTSLRKVISLAGGLHEGRNARAVLLGGAAGSFVRPNELDVHLSHEAAHAAGLTLGSGVVLVLDDTIDIHAIVRRIAAFFRDESCGQCVPCRVGVVRQEESLHRLQAGSPRGGVAGELALLEDVGIAMRDASICGLGQSAYSAVESAIKRLGLFEPPPPTSRE